MRLAARGRGAAGRQRGRVDTLSLSSRAVDDAGRAAVADGRSLYVVDEELLAALAPDLVLTQDLCAVCAVGERRPVPHRRARLSPRPEDARRRRRVHRVRRGGARLARGRARPRLAVPTRRCGGAGGDRRATAPAGLSRRVGRSALRAGALASRSWSTWRAASASSDVRRRNPFARRGTLSAPSVPSWSCSHRAATASSGPRASRFSHGLGCPVVAVDGSAYARPAPRLADGARQLAYLLHPEACGAIPGSGPATSPPS